MDSTLFAKIATALGVLKFISLQPAAAHDKEAGPTKETAAAQHDDAMHRYATFMEGPKVTIGMLIYPGMFLQDLVGPLTVFESLMNRDIHLLWKNTDPVGGDDPQRPTLIPVRATTTFADCPDKLDVLFVPGGGAGTLAIMEDPQVLAFLAEKGKSARYITSVCTGSLILGAAGLLKGYRANSYWATRGVLSELGAILLRDELWWIAIALLAVA